MFFFSHASCMAQGVAISVSSPLWSLLKCLNNYWMGIAMKSGTDIHGPYRMNCNNFGDPLTLHVAASGQILYSSGTLI